MFIKIGSFFQRIGGTELLKKAALFLIVPVLLLGAYVVNFNWKEDKKSVALNVGEVNPTSASTVSNVLGASYRAPQIYIYSGDQQSVSSGVFALASTAEPAVFIGGYNTNGNAEITLYQTNDDALLDYITHDKEGKQTKKTPDAAKLKLQATLSKNISGETKVVLPLTEKGIWYMKVKIGAITADAFIIRSNLGAIAKEGNNEFIFWTQDFKTKKSVTEGLIIPYNLLDGRRELERASIGSDGIAKARLTKDADIAIVAQNDDRALIPINLKYINYYNNWQSFREKVRNTKYFIFTDRPLYKPGDTVYYKAVLREDDDARYTIPGGNVQVQIYDGYYYAGSETSPVPVFENSSSVSSNGSINGEYKIPADAKVGYYSLNIKMPDQTEARDYWTGEYSPSSISFEVQHYKKPEFTLDITSPKTEVIAGDKTTFTINGSYFSGQPLINQKVKYAVYSADFYEYQYLTDYVSLSHTISDDYRYGYWYGGEVKNGFATLDASGKVEIEIDTKIQNSLGKSQVFSIEATIEDGSQTPSFARKNILVYAGEYGIFRKDYSYGAKVNTQLSIPLMIRGYGNSVKTSNVDLTAKILREEWVAESVPNSKYPNYRKIEENLPEIKIKTDGSGNANISFKPGKVGSYKITVEGTDSRKNKISKIFYTYITSDDYPIYNEYGGVDLTIAADKQKYQTNDRARLTINSIVPGRDIFLSIERGRVDRYQIVHMNGKTATVEIPIVDSDLPNVYAKVSSFDENTMNNGQVNLPVSTDQKKLDVKISTDSKTFGPGETVNVNISTTDLSGNPKSAEVALWSVDRAIFELRDTTTGDIFDTFWKERYTSTQQAHSLEGIAILQGGGGCFVEGTKILMADGSTKNIEDIKVGEKILTRSSEKDSKQVAASVTELHNASEGGYLIINHKIKVTADHIMWINGSWKEAGSIQKGDTLVSEHGESIKVSSVEWQRGKVNVYNLEVEKYHTYFAEGVWVHNQKGGGGRTIFEDTAYWNPTIQTDNNGRAQVSFKLPDNLTTWVIAAVASTQDTRVGQTTSEIIVTKDVIVRPILPNILRIGDEAYFSALVQNFTDKEQTFDIELKFDAGNVEEALRPATKIKPSEMEQIYWKVKATKENSSAKITVAARSKSGSDSDQITLTIPVRPFTFEERRAETGDGNKTFAVSLAPDSHKEKSKVTLSLSPSILGTLFVAMNYLVDYAYGCVEQTTSRFVPAVIAKLNSGIFDQALKDKDINDIINKGVTKLSTQQQPDGGWTWWYSGASEPFITSYVVEYLLLAKQTGAKIDEPMLERAKNYLSQDSFYSYKTNQYAALSREDNVAKMYGLTLLGAREKVLPITDFNLGPDILSLAVMTNYLNGNTNPATNGLNNLVALAQTQGDAIFWNPGFKTNFGSTDASTALAIRAIVIAGGDRELAAKGARYLTRNRKSDYWSNTYATSQVVRALTELSKTGSELDPNYSYNVTLDGKRIAQGQVTGARQIIQDIVVPVKDIKGDGSNLVITKSGEGQIYSTLLINEQRTDRKAKALNHGLVVKREYVNDKGQVYSQIGVGETVNVNITVSGLSTYENYGMIQDELPAGLAPINETFRNEQYGNNQYSQYYYSYNVTDTEVTENGMIMTLYQVAPGEKTYTYRARVVSEGKFIVPPATASLMYSPEVYGRSDAQEITVGKDSKFVPGTGSGLVDSTTSRAIFVTLLVLLGGIVTSVLIFYHKGLNVEIIKSKIDAIKNRLKPPSQQ